MTPAQRRMVEILRRDFAGEAWYWDVLDAWSCRMPAGLAWVNGDRTLRVLLSRGILRKDPDGYLTLGSDTDRRGLES